MLYLDSVTVHSGHCCHIHFFYSPEKMGLLDPATSDGRVIFVLPWEGKTIAGTTDHKCNLTFDPKPTEKEIQFILNEITHYLNPDIHGKTLHTLSVLMQILSHPSKDVPSTLKIISYGISVKKLRLTLVMVSSLEFLKLYDSILHSTMKNVIYDLVYFTPYNNGLLYTILN